MIRLLHLCHQSIIVRAAFGVVVVNPPSPRSNDDCIQRVAIALAIFVAAFVAISFRPNAVVVEPVRDAPWQPDMRLLLGHRWVVHPKPPDIVIVPRPPLLPPELISQVGPVPP